MRHKHPPNRGGLLVCPSLCPCVFWGPEADFQQKGGRAQKQWVLLRSRVNRPGEKRLVGKKTDQEEKCTTEKILSIQLKCSLILGKKTTVIEFSHGTNLVQLPEHQSSAGSLFEGHCCKSIVLKGVGLPEWTLPACAGCHGQCPRTRKNPTCVALRFIPVSLRIEHPQWTGHGLGILESASLGKGSWEPSAETQQPQGPEGTVDNGFRALCSLGKTISSQLTPPQGSRRALLTSFPIKCLLNKVYSAFSLGRPGTPRSSAPSNLNLRVVGC